MKKTVCLVLCVLFLLSFTNIVQAFSDTSDHWAKDYIERLFNIRAIKGYPDGTFKPENPITRAELATILARAFKLPDTDPQGFLDVQGHWAIQEIGACEDIIPSYTTGKFDPDAPVSREHLAVALVRCRNLAKGLLQADRTILASLVDRDQITASLVTELSLAIQVGYLHVYPDQTLRPRSAVTRAEAAKLIDRPLSSTLVSLAIRPIVRELMVGQKQQFSVDYVNAYGQIFQVTDGFVLCRLLCANTAGTLSTTDEYTAERKGIETITAQCGNPNLSTSLTINVSEIGTPAPPSEWAPVKDYKVGELVRLPNGLELTVTKVERTISPPRIGAFYTVDTLSFDLSFRNVGSDTLYVSSSDFYLVNPDRSLYPKFWGFESKEYGVGEGDQGTVGFDLFREITKDWRFIYKPFGLFSLDFYDAITMLPMIP